MDLNHYALERMVEARLAEAREARRHRALVASVAAGGARRGRRPERRAAVRSRRFVALVFGIPGGARERRDRMRHSGPCSETPGEGTPDVAPAASSRHLLSAS